MSYVYSNVDALEGTAKVGSKQCVVLLQHYASLPSTSLWKEGTKVVDSESIAKGTAIATFKNGKYESKATGNHGAFFVTHIRDKEDKIVSISIMDQWADDTKKPYVSKRDIRRKGKSNNGDYVDPSNNADAYSIIE